MQKKLNKAETRFTQSSMDKIFRKRGKRKSLVEYALAFSRHNPPKTVTSMLRKAKPSTNYHRRKRLTTDVIQVTPTKISIRHFLNMTSNFRLFHKKSDQTTDFITFFHNSSLKIQPISEAFTFP